MAQAPIPETTNLPKLREAAAGCKACDLWKTGTQTVFGEGSKSAEIVFVGEQPGNREDLAGEPFVGPAGRVFDKRLDAAGIDRRLAYVTNAVKHFKWEARGKRCIHQKPNATELAACRPWLDAELDAVHAKVLVAMGATAAQALLGREFRVTKDRAGRSTPIWRPTSLRQFIPLRSCDKGLMTSAARRCGTSWRI